MDVFPRCDFRAQRAACEAQNDFRVEALNKHVEVLKITAQLPGEKKVVDKHRGARVEPGVVYVRECP